MRGSLALALLVATSVPTSERPAPATPSGEIQLPNGRLLTPTGTQTSVLPYPFALEVTPEGRRVVVASTGAEDQALQLLDAASGALLATQKVERSWLGLALSPDGTRAYLAGAKDKSVLVFRMERDRFVAETPIPITTPEDGAKDASPSGIAVSRDGRWLWVARLLADDLVKVDLATGKVAGRIPVGTHPYRPVLSPDGRTVAVGNWGGASVSLVDADGARVIRTIATADHPCDLVFSPGGQVLFVAQANRNLVAVVDPAAGKVVRQISVAMGPAGPGTPSADALPDGSTPNALALAKDGRTLFVANADDDAVAVIGISDDVTRARTVGFIPTGWYPDALALSADGKVLFVANGKGSGSRANARDGPNPSRKTKGRPQGSIVLLPGSVSRIPLPSRKGLSSLTVRAYANRKPAARGASPARVSKVIPAAAGTASPIRHVIYVIRENRTYDQVFGDIAKGNGDPSLAIFGRDVTPNAHALAEEFVLLDSFFADAEISADGHNWSMGAYATDFTEKLWPPDYGNKGFGYYFEGDDETAYPTAGYLWDAAARAGLSLRNYGEFVGIPASGAKYTGVFQGKPAALRETTCPFYPGFDLDILDNARVDLWLKEFRGFVADKDFPSLMIVRLGNDHTSGTKKGAKTPRAMVAENDLALGRLVEAVSRSPYWKETAIFVVEDDAQSGSDHVDAHRTVALVASPYTRGGAVDSTLYSTTSMLRTMELILGLPPLSQHDASATPMTNAFRDTGDTSPFAHREVAIPLYETNPDGAPMQEQAEAWDLSREDAAPDILLNEAIWKSVRGADAEMPAPVNSAFVRAR